MAKRKKKQSKASAVTTPPPINSIADFDRAAARASAYLARPLNLKEIRLPAGQIKGINLGWWSNGAQININPSSWLSTHPDGVRLVGAGAARTVVRWAPGNGNALSVIRHNGVVQLEGVTLVSGTNAAVQFGEQNLDGDRRTDGSLIYGTQRITCPKFALRLYDSHVLAPPPSELGGIRAKWGLFSYQSDEHVRDVVIDLTEALEHDYRHGAAFRGRAWQRVRVLGAGSECIKERPDASETAWAGPNVWTILQHVVAKQWGQPHGNYSRGGGVVLQNAGTHVLIEDSALIGRDAHSGCVMISAEGNAYDMDTGRLGNGFAHGFIVIRRCGLTGSQTAGFWNNEVVSVYRNAGTHQASKGFILEHSAAYGQNSILKLASAPAGTVFVRESNRPEDRQRAESIGINTTYETTIPTSARLVPVSEGYSR